MNIYGFTLLRNGIKYDYCFIESLKSLGAVTKEVYLALGAGEDKTEDEVAKLDFIKTIPTVWDDSLREGGLILSQQTNIALNECRKNHRDETGAWGIYLQCDEVFHEDDYELIQEDIKKAEESGCDVMTFRYLHFWQSHHRIAINKKWYPQEIRAVKLNTEIESWGDAQSFRNYNKVYHSEARIFHYGHVREEGKYKSKKSDILKLYHADEKMKKYKRREKRFDDMTECLEFWGSHPTLMKARIERLGEKFAPDEREVIYIVGSEKKFDKKFVKNILAKNVIWVKSKREIPREFREDCVVSDPNLMDKIFHRSRVPDMMRSKLARPWSREFILTLKLSEKGIGVQASTSSN